MPAFREALRCALLASATAACALASSAHAKQPYKMLHAFAGGPGDGAYIYNPLTLGPDGALYGAANLGGSSNNGAIFKIAKDGTETLLYSFAGGPEGSDPNAGITIDPATGDLFGTATFGGGGACRNGCGVLYKLTAGGAYTVLHTFDGATDGRYPAGQLIRDRLGNLYGIGTSGGPGGAGTVFRYSAGGSFKVLHAFSGSDGFSPEGRLLRDRAGNLYGVTMEGGASDYGAIYTMKPNGKAFSVLYSFSGGADGGYPSGGLDRDSAGNLYGATNPAGNGRYPNGTVYRLSPNGSLTTLYVFSGGAGGAYPAGDILQSKGKLYGTTTGGGAGEQGAVYEVDAASGGETVLHSFTGNDGANPQAGLIENHAFLYGTAAGGGAGGYGVAFRIKRK